MNCMQIKKTRTGLRVRSLPGVHPEVRRACLEFASWIRGNMEFPIRVVVYLKKDYYILTKFNEEVSASFFAPYNKNDEPYIRIATGDFEELDSKYGRNNTLASYLVSFAHELIHYQQWIHDEPFLEKEAEEKANVIVDQYAESREYP
ncbi:hypothetical protein [Paenibacillus sp. FSL W8-0194]|uniref:hypothetical protein n=1 Tax=Paenibacillus sp. FSL W8-0194 TaxID=2921711 RepID=UPI0030D98DDE